MKATPQSSSSVARRARVVCVSTLLLVTSLAAASPASAQLSRVGVTKSVVPGALLFGDVAHDPRNNVYLSVIAWGTVWAAFADANGTMITSFTIPTPAGANPRVAYGPDLNGGQGGFLVTFHQLDGNLNFVHSAVVSYPGGVVSLDGVAPHLAAVQGSTVSAGALSAPQGGGPSIAYSPDAKKFLVTWTGEGWSIKGRLVNGVTGVPEGDVITVVGPIGTQQSAAAWNPHTKEFGVGFAGFGAYMGLVRVNTAGAVVATSGPFGQSTGTFNTALAVNSAGRYVLGWSAPGGAYSLELDGNGTPLANFPTLISGRLGTPTSFAFALNPVSGTILAVSEGVDSREVPGVEMNSAGVPLGTAIDLTDGAGTAGAGGSYAPRVTARSTAKQWNISYSRYTTGYELANQIVATGSTDAGGGPPPPPPPPPPPGPSISALNPSHVLPSQVGTSITWTAAASGGSSPLLYRFERWRPGTGWQTVRLYDPAPSAVILAVTGNQAIRVSVKTTTSSADADALSNPVYFVPAANRALSLNIVGGGDVFAYHGGNGGGYLLSGDLGVLTEVNYGMDWGAGNAVVPADFNGDGLGDLLTYNAGTGYARRAINQGDNSFVYAEYPWDAGLTVVAGDFNGDGRDDIFTYSKTTGIWTKQLTDVAWVFQPSSGTWSRNWEVYPGDFNGDGITDIFVYNKTPGSADTGRYVRVLNAPNGNFAAYVEGSLRWWTGWTVSTGDFDGDGKTDLFLYGTDGRWYKVFFPTTSGAERYTSGPWSVGWTTRVGDFNGDRKDDVFVYNQLTGAWYVCISDGDNWKYYTQMPWGSGFVPTVTDINRDGLADLIVYNPSDGRWFQIISSANPGQFGYYTGPNMETGLQMIASLSGR